MMVPSNNTLERTSDHRGRAVLAINCALGAESPSCQATRSSERNGSSMKVIASIAIALLLSACESVTEANAQAEEAAAAFEREIGTRPFVGWNIYNGKLVQVTFLFESDKIANYTVRDLENRAIRIVATSFKSTPSQITISATWKQ